MSTRPDLDLAFAAALAHRHWDLDGELVELGSYDDRNFRLSYGDQRVVLKLSSRALESLGVIDLQEQTLARLAKGVCGPLVPSVVRSSAGLSVVPFTDAAGQPCSARVLTWLWGPLWCSMGTTPPSPALLRSLGERVAQIACELEGLAHPQMGRHMIWNLVEAGWVADELEIVDPGPRRDLIEEVMADFRARAMPGLAALPTQIIHGDLNNQNLVVGPESGPVAVTGIFDFGDVVTAPAVCDLAIALAYALMGLEGEALGRACGIACSSYHAQRPLPLAEVGLLFDLIRARLAVSVVSSALARRREPDNSYTSASEAEGWALLEALTRLGREALVAAVVRER